MNLFILYYYNFIRLNKLIISMKLILILSYDLPLLLIIIIIKDKLQMKDFVLFIRIINI